MSLGITILSVIRTRMHNASSINIKTIAWSGEEARRGEDGRGEERGGVHLEKRVNVIHTISDPPSGRLVISSNVRIDE